MGKVYLAFDPVLDRKVAIKVIRFERATTSTAREEFKERFFREGRIGACLTHPNIVAIFDMGDYKGHPYLVMEFVKGSALAERLNPNEPMPPETFLSILEQIALGLDAAHARGITHRDIKPHNIVITPTGQAKILDFGMARLVDSKMTKAGEFVGTPNYSSPEQVQAQPVDSRSDIFSLAVMAHELITGKTPFAGSSISAVLFKIVAGEPEIADCPPHLGVNREEMFSLFRKALARDRDQRYQTAAALVAALRETFGGPSEDMSTLMLFPEHAEKTMTFPIQFWDSVGSSIPGDDSVAPPMSLPPEPIAEPISPEKPEEVQEETPQKEKPKPKVATWLWVMGGVLILGFVVIFAITRPSDDEHLQSRWAEAVAAEDAAEVQTLLTLLRDRGLATDDHDQVLADLQKRGEIRTRREELAKAWQNPELAATLIAALEQLQVDMSAERDRLEKLTQGQAERLGNLEQRLRVALIAKDLARAKSLAAQLRDSGGDTGSYDSFLQDLSRLAADFEAAQEQESKQAAIILTEIEKLVGPDPPKREILRDMLVEEMTHALDAKDLRLAQSLAADFEVWGFPVHRLADIKTLEKDRQIVSLRGRLKSALDQGDTKQAKTLMARMTRMGLETAAEHQRLKKLQEKKRTTLVTENQRSNKLNETRGATAALLADLNSSLTEEELSLIHRKATMASGEQLYNLAQRYKGAAENSSDQRLWSAYLRLASEKGHGLAQLLLGDYFIKTDNFAPAHHWYQKASEAGMAEAKLQLGNLYLGGIGVAKSEVKAFAWFSKAAKNQLPLAETQVGIMYYYGMGVGKDINQAYEHLVLAAQSGERQAQYWVGYFYEKGISVLVSKPTAIGWYRMSAKQGYNDATERLKLLERN